MSNANAHCLTVAEIGEALRGRRLALVELMPTLLERLAAHAGKLHAFIRLDADAALDAARAAEKEMAAGRTLGPLHGVPIGIKDIIDVAGVPTTCHSRIMLENEAAADAEVVTRLRGA